MTADSGVLIWPEWLITSHLDEPHRDWGIRVVGNSVQAVGPTAELQAAYPNDETILAPNRICLPGFVNTHVHLYGVLAHGISTASAPGDFWAFLEQYWWPQVEDALDTTMIAAAADWACYEMLRSGVTTFLDILEAPNSLPGSLQVEMDAVARAGIRGILSFEATERAGARVAEQSLRENVDLISASRDHELISAVVSFHTTFTCSDDYIRRAFDLASANDVLVHAHVNEGRFEGDRNKAKHGRSTFEHYDAIGVDLTNFLASQCVQLTPGDRAIIADRGVRVSHMPLSNCEVGGGIAPIPELLEAEVTVGLGSDGYINDFYEVMRGAFLIHKARLEDPSTMPAHEVLGLATANGAAALGLDNVGRLDVGWSADLQLVDSKFPTTLHGHNLIEQLLLWRNQSHVTDVMVAGKWRIRHGDFLGTDIERLRGRAQEESQRLWAK